MGAGPCSVKSGLMDHCTEVLMRTTTLHFMEHPLVAVLMRTALEAGLHGEPCGAVLLRTDFMKQPSVLGAVLMRIALRSSPRTDSGTGFWFCPTALGKIGIKRY